MKGCFRSSAHDFLWLGSFCKQHSMKLTKSELYLDESSLGASLEEIKYMALIGYILKWGGSPSANSIAIIPVDQTSTFSS